MSKREQVLSAVFAMIGGAAPAGVVPVRNQEKPSRIGPNGAILMRDGDPGEPSDVDLSPLTYYYEHKVPLEVAFVPSGVQTKEQALDALLAPLGAAVSADRTLGGLCLFLEVEAPSISGLEATGAVTGLWADLAIIATYATNDPLN